jgi:hypothetical protein
MQAEASGDTAQAEALRAQEARVARTAGAPRRAAAASSGGGSSGSSGAAARPRRDDSDDPLAGLDGL